MRNIKLIIEYDGSNYAGWQRQTNASTIQQTIECCLEDITKEKINVIGSSRTDSGVHAKGFVLNFKTESKIPDRSFREALNSKLPRDIVVLESKEVDLSFHARYSSVGKKYSYTILNAPQPAAIGRQYIYHYKRPLDYIAMSEACGHYIGEHDYSAFRTIGSSVKTTVRNVKDAFLVKENNKIIFMVEADGFLYNMVRIMVGTLIDVGTHKISSKNIPDIIKSKDRNKAGKTAPASGLCLEKVYY